MVVNDTKIRAPAPARACLGDVSTHLLRSARARWLGAEEGTILAGPGSVALPGRPDHRTYAPHVR